MATIGEQQQIEKDVYAIEVQRANSVPLWGGAGGYDESGGSSIDPSAYSPTGNPITIFGPVSLNDAYCQIPTNSSMAAFPSKIILPEGNRSEIAMGPYQFRDSYGAQGLVQCTSSNFKHVNSYQNWFDPKLLYYMEVLFKNVASKLDVKQLQINSGFRTPAEEKELCGSSSISSHCAGWAIDISAFDDDRFTIADAAYYIGFGGIAIGNSYVHLDINATGRFSEDGLGWKYVSPEKHQG